MGKSVKDEAQWLPKCIFTLEKNCTDVGIINVWNLGWKGKKNNKLGPHDTIKKVLKCRCLKCLHIVYLDVMYMSYNKNKRQESNSHP
jgi:hypothetical protein